MQKLKIYKSLILSFLALSFTNFQCEKEAVAAFCETDRSVYKTVDNKEGTIIYFEKYERYAILFKTDTPNNIDTQIIGLPCDLSPEFKQPGLAVNASGS